LDERAAEMNKYNLAVLNNFRDQENISYLHVKILNHYSGNNVVARYLRGSLIQSLMNFADMAEKEDFMYTQPQTTVYGRSQNENVLEGVACMNMRYMDYIFDFIDQNILYDGDRATAADTRSQMTNTDTWDVNDGLNASSRTIVQSMPRNKLCDTDTSWIDEPNMKSLVPALDQQYKAIQVREITNDNGGGKCDARQLSTVSNPSRTVKTVAETLESWRYPTRGAMIRDDPVGEIVRDRDAPKFRNQNEFPYGNSGLTSYKGNPGNSAPGFLDGSRPPPELARNPNETYQGESVSREYLQRNEYPYESNVYMPRQLAQRRQHTREQKCCDFGDCGLCTRGGASDTREGYQTRPQLATKYDTVSAASGVYNKQSCAKGCQRGGCGGNGGGCVNYTAHPNGLRTPNSLHGAKSGLLGESEMNKLASTYADGVINNTRFVFRDYANGRAPRRDGYDELHTGDAVASQNLKTAPGNSLCAYSPANIMIGDGFHYRGTDNNGPDDGTYADKYTGVDEISSITNSPLDRLLSTKMIQSLNNQYGDVPTPEAVSSVYDMQAGRKRAEANYGGSNIFTGGTFGGNDRPPIRSGFLEKSLSKIDTRDDNSKGYHFSSDGVQFLRSEGFADRMRDYDLRLETERRGCQSVGEGRGYVNLPQNNKKLWWGKEGGFADDSNAAEMQRLLNRRIFRSWAPGKYGEKGITTSGDSAQEQIPYWQKAIHNRSYERDADEAVGGFETDGMIRGYGKDMIELYCRIPQKYPCGDKFK